MITLPEEQNKSLHEIKQKSPVELAFVGDAVYELMVREYISLNHDAPAGKLHSMCVDYVRAEAQVKAFERIQQYLTEEELDFVRKGRNANKVTASKNAEPAAYRIATGMETMFGYLYLSGNNDRIRQLFNMIFEGQEA